MTEELDIRHEFDDTGGRYFVRLQNGETAKMAYATHASGIRDFNHTYVPKAFRGSGVAALLMARAIADARAQGFRIVPSCTYVVAQFRRHADWRDLLAEGLTPENIGDGACSLPPSGRRDGNSE